MGGWGWVVGGGGRWLGVGVGGWGWVVGGGGGGGVGDIIIHACARAYVCAYTQRHKVHFLRVTIN